jgi:aminoglycoside 6'-N-acetyltransferase I
MKASNEIHIRPARSQDCAELARLRNALWPESSSREHAEELAELLEGRLLGTMPQQVFVAESSDGRLLGFAEVGLRSHAEGCDFSRAVGYLEGWFVLESCRRRGIGSALLRAAEGWARGQGCRELASDASLDNKVSQRAHEARGFTSVGRSVNYRKAL